MARQKPNSYVMEIHQGPGHKARVVAHETRKVGGEVKVTRALAYCTCGWDTPILFNIKPVVAAVNNHLADVSGVVVTIPETN